MRGKNGQALAKVRPFEPIAIIGMRGRFPGANDLETYWQNLAQGVESIVTLTPEEIRASGVPDSISHLPGYVNASPVIDGVDMFDAEFFGFSARDASLTDPQHRLFLETAWEALEDAGYEPANFLGPIGVFGGCEMSTYLYQLSQNADALKYIDGMQLMVTNDKDHLCTQVAYRLNLRGPSVTVQTTCSTSLVAVAMACESLQSGACEMALAGGVTVRVPQRGGYFYTAGSILSPDGHCRPFDVNAQGTIVGSGVGIVVLKRLSDALASRDNVRAVILGAGVNNDGNDKVGYTAPSFRGQAAAIRAAHAASGVAPDSIGYVEAHGTGTILGDPIELSALTEVFQEKTERRAFCGVGSVKSNFGHLSCAAGVAGLIKTVLTLERGAIPPTLHYTAPNPAIDFAKSPFYVATKLNPWKRNGAPRRAGVSSFGVGGTNAHLVLEEARKRPAPNECRSEQLVLLSARTEAALDSATTQLAHHLRTHPKLRVPDVAFTLQIGRRFFRHRRFLNVQSDDRQGLIAALSAPNRLGRTVAATSRPVVFMFPGQGSQYPGMCAGLYEHEPLIRKAIDRCARLLKPALEADLRGVLFPAKSRRKSAAQVLKDTRWAQPALFTIGYALAQLWRSWGIQPGAMIGHSVGEYVAAAVAGVMSLPDALRLIAERGRLISSLPRGSMLAVMAPMESVERFVDREIALAAVNAPGLAVLSGPDRAIARVEEALTKESVAARRLHTSHAFHSAMMEPILKEFGDLVAKVRLSAPSIPFVAAMTGQWADGIVTKPDYWIAQLRSSVRFADGVRTIADPDGAVGKDALYLELGPGNTLTTFVGRTAGNNGKPPPCFPSLPGPAERRPDTEVILNALGQLWANGATCDWEGFHKTEPGARVSLPTYPFERQSYWIGPKPDAITPAHEARDVSGWFARPIWKETALASDETHSLGGRRVLVFDEQTGLGAKVIERLRGADAEPIAVRKGDRFRADGERTYLLNPVEPEGIRQLCARVCGSESRLAGVIDCWSASPPGETDLDVAAVDTLLLPMRLVHALSGLPTLRPLPVLLVARGTARVHDTDPIDPPRGLGIGPARVLPQEHPGVRVAHIDVDSAPGLAELLVAEFVAGAAEPTVAFRAGRRLVEDFEPFTIGPAELPNDLPEEPVVFVTGGLGHMGMSLAEVMFAKARARLVLVGRSVLPDPDEWAAKSEDQNVAPEMRVLLRRLATMRAKRDDVLVLKADFNNAAQVTSAVDAAIAHFGRIDLAVHGAARIDPGAFASAAETGPSVVEAQFSPKLRGLFHLMNALRGREPRRWILHSSISSVLGGLGLGVYTGANAVLDLIALSRGENWLSIGWDAWDNAGEAGSPGMPVPIYPTEGEEVFLRLLGSKSAGSRAIVVVNDLMSRFNAWVRHTEAAPEKTGGGELHPRPNLATPFVEPSTPTERGLAEIWGAQLGIEGIGAHDRFFDLGGHSLLAVQVASEIRDRFEIEIPVLKLFQAPTVAELAQLIDKAKTSGGFEAITAKSELATPAATPLGSDAVGQAKAGYRDFYNDITKRLERSGVGEASFFLNYGYVSLGQGDEACFEVLEGVFNPNSVRLAFELIGRINLRNRRVLDVGCGRGGTVALITDRFAAKVSGVDLAPEAIAFCRRTHQQAAGFEVGDAEHLPFADGSFDVVTNIESSHTYPNLRAFYAEVRRVLVGGGDFLYTDLLPVSRWAEVQVLLASLGFTINTERDITANVLGSCDEIAATRAQAFGDANAMIDNFLAVPGSAVYEQMKSGAWSYRIVRARRA
jgi:phthiocerol/phenolphthiocerol synthesis type-I polyketide synthase E